MTSSVRAPGTTADPLRGLGRTGEAAARLPSKEQAAASNRGFLVCSGVV